MKVRHTTVDALESNPSGRRTKISNQITSGIAQDRSSAASQPVPTEIKRQRRKTKSRPKLSTVAIYASVFVLLVVMVAIGYQSPKSANGASTVASVTQTSSSLVVPQRQADPSVDDVVATAIAANVANAADMSVAPAVASQAISAQITSQMPQVADSTTISKPSIAQSTSTDYSIKTYVSVAGDDVNSVAAKFGVTANTVEWANDLAADTLTPGTSLKILPVDGILYTVKDGDTLQSIADKYHSDITRVTLINDLTNGTVATGQQLILPDGVLPTTERPGYVAPQKMTFNNSGATWWSGGTVYAGNTYAFGNCTWYVYNRRMQMGLPVGSNWGDARTWALAARDSRLVDGTPSVGAVAQWNQYQGGSLYWGHVAVVEGVYDDGSITISEMNNYAYGGFDRIDNRGGQHIYPGDANWPSNFIH